MNVMVVLAKIQIEATASHLFITIRQQVITKILL
jgi:hypothetical protein